MTRTALVILSALLAAMIASGGAFLVVATELGDGKGLGDVSGLTWVVIAVTGLIAGAKDLRTYAESTLFPPKPPGMPLTR